MSDDQIPPELDDFETQIKVINANKPIKSNNKSQKIQQDYTKVNTRHIEDQKKLAEQINKIKITQKKIQKQIQKNIKKQDFGGFKKGFLGGGNKSTSTTISKKQQKIPELKATNKNPLQIKEVQQAMKMNNYLDSTRKQWMTQKFLQNVTSNDKVNKLFSNPEYMKAIDMFKTNPKQAMLKYGNNKQFMQGFQQFCKMMGMQFQNLAKNQPKK